MSTQPEGGLTRDLADKGKSGQVSHLRVHVCHLPAGLGTAPALISAGYQLGIGAFAYLITGNGALVAHVSAKIADGCGEGGIPQHEIFTGLAGLGAVLQEPQMIGRDVGTTLLDRILNRLDANHMTLFTVLKSLLKHLIGCLHTSSSFVYGGVLRQLRFGDFSPDKVYVVETPVSSINSNLHHSLTG